MRPDYRQIVFAEDRRRMEMRMEKETLRANLLRTISHDCVHR